MAERMRQGVAGFFISLRIKKQLSHPEVCLVYSVFEILPLVDSGRFTFHSCFNDGICLLCHHYFL